MKRKLSSQEKISEEIESIKKKTNLNLLPSLTNVFLLKQIFLKIYKKKQT